MNACIPLVPDRLHFRRRKTGRTMRQDRGFTMIELVLVLCVVALLAVFAAASFNTDQERLSSEAEQLRSTLHYAQSLAFAQSQLPAGSAPITWGVLIGSNSYSLRMNGQAQTAIFIPTTSSATHTLPSGVSITGGTGEIRFDFRGIPVKSDGFAAETENTVIRLEAGSSTDTITVTHGTGFIQ